MVPGILVASHYAIQILRPAWGYGSDVGGRRTPWILGGMAALALGGTGAALATALAASHLALGLALAALSFLLVGVGAGAAGTSVLAMLASAVAPARRAGAATTVWVMMILGFAITAPLAGHFLDPFSQSSADRGDGVGLYSRRSSLPSSRSLASSAAWRPPTPARGGIARPPFRQAFAEVWREPAARRFTIFIFVSMLAYSAQELLVEPYAGLVFAMTPGATTKLAGVQHGGVLLGMLSRRLLRLRDRRADPRLAPVMDDRRLPCFRGSRWSPSRSAAAHASARGPARSASSRSASPTALSRSPRSVR